MTRRLIATALSAVVLAGCASRPPAYDGKILDDNLRGTGPGWDQTRTAGPPPMPPAVTPAVQKAIAAERRRQNVRYRATTPEHGRQQPADTNRFVGPVKPHHL